MKKLGILLFAFLLSVTLFGCNDKEEIKEEISLIDIKEIGELVSMEYIIHEVAKYEGETLKKWYEFWEDETLKFWVEYDVRVETGIDINKLDIDINGNKIAIKEPQLKIIVASIISDTLTEKSFFFEGNHSKPTPELQNKVLNESKEDLANKMLNDETIAKQTINSAKESITAHLMSRVRSPVCCSPDRRWAPRSSPSP